MHVVVQMRLTILKHKRTYTCAHYLTCTKVTTTDVFGDISDVVRESRKTSLLHFGLRNGYY